MSEICDQQGASIAPLKCDVVGFGETPMHPFGKPLNLKSSGDVAARVQTKYGYGASCIVRAVERVAGDVDSKVTRGLSPGGEYLLGVAAVTDDSDRTPRLREVYNGSGGMGKRVQRRMGPGPRSNARYSPRAGHGARYIRRTVLTR